MAINSIKKTTVSGVTLATSTDNQVATVTGANALTGESNLTFDGTDLIVTGNVGIGATSLGHPLVVEKSGNAYVHSYSTGQSAGIKIQSASANFTLYADTGTNALKLYDNNAGAERMRIDSSGRVQIGGTITNGNCLNAQDSADGINSYFENSNASFASRVIQFNATRAATSSYSFMLLYSSGGGDQEFNLRGDGNAYADASWNGSGADYQEYFESQSGVAAEVGRTVVLDGDQIRYYNAATDSADDIIGVTRPEADNKNSAVVGNIAWNHWTDKYLTDDWGVYEREDITVYQWQVKENETDTGVTHTVQQYSSLWHYNHGTVSEYVPVGSVTIPADAVQTTDNVRKLNPAFDPAQEANYKSREDRDEWWLIGLLGQIQIKAGEPTNPRWIKMKDISANVELWYVR